MENIVLANTEACTGCGACKAICPKEAISFVADHEGFPFPRIDDENCIECGSCTKVCPVMDIPASSSILCSYAVQIKDRELLMNSTSGGGIFGGLSNAVINRGE